MAENNQALAIVDEFATSDREQFDFVFGELAKSGEQITTGDLIRVKFPTGGDTEWTIPRADGNQHAERIEGVLLAQQPQRAWWENVDVVSDDAPACSSVDGVTGIPREETLFGSEGVPLDCSKCPMGQFESHPKGGGGQWCKATQNLFVLTKYSFWPLLISVPAGSLSEWSGYMKGLLGIGKSPTRQVTGFSLVSAKSSRTNTAFAKLSVQGLGDLTVEQVEFFGGYFQRLGLKTQHDPYTVPVEAADVVDE